MWTHCLACLMLAAAPSDPPAPGPAGPAAEHFAKLFKDRSRISSGYIEYAVKRDVDEKNKDLEGSVTRYRVWFDEKCRRMDIAEDRPGDPGNALKTRYANSDGTHRVIDIDQPDVAVREYTRGYLQGTAPPGVFALSGHYVDPRILGVFGEEYGLLQHRKLDELNGDPKRPAAVSTVSVGGRTVTRVTLDYPRGKREAYDFVPDSPLPAAIRVDFVKETESGKVLPPTRVEVKSDVTTWPDARGGRIAFPRTMTVSRFVNDAVESSETVTVTDARFNGPVNASDLTWKAINPPVGATLIRDGDTQWDAANSNSVEWTGEKFELVSSNPLLLKQAGGDGDAGRSASLRWASAATASLAVGFAGVALASRSRRKRSHDSQFVLSR